MSVHLFKHEVSYFSVPKCACTSLKLCFFEIENGFPFRSYTANGVSKHIHNAAYPSVPYAKVRRGRIASHWKAAVVRHPIGRVLSCFKNRVEYHGELDNVALTDEDRENGVVTSPDLPTFIRHLERYKDLSPPVRHHAEPLSHFLGTDPGYFDRIYPISKVDEFAEEIGRRTGRIVKVGREQVSGSKASRKDLSAEEVSKLETLFAEDLELYGEFFE
ncbi:sulfotransferase family protein [Aliiruegeria haliotis]|uniref:Sulfotransferase family protein n=1 Tax=Aliiruegeria haliotis TaxID=1280846 RepID=A0A2T0RQ31_9RHOB|nr:sulfotransferase family 2 domain-containing protein [Aliiruegeria haliotis]PRY23242.1 sulfotransferase family protein [Aliiruegeria haliotis]